MNSRLLTNLAILQSGWISGTFTGYLPFLFTYIHQENKNSFSINEIAKWFEKELERKIPIFAMKSILEEAKVMGYICESSLTPNSYVVNRISIDYKSDEEKEIIDSFNKIILNIREETKDKLGIDLETKELENVLLDFLLDNDAQIFIDNLSIDVPDILQTSKYAVLSYIKNCYIQKNEEYDYLVKIAQGHMLANYSIINSNIEEFDLSNKYFFLDSNIIFCLLRLSENDFLNQGLTELVDLIKNSKGNIYIFKHILDEAKIIIENSKTWIRNPIYYDPIKASNVTKYMIDHKKTIKDVDVYLASIDGLFAKYNINVMEANYNSLGHPLIDENKLYELIINEYKRTSWLFDEEEKRTTIWNDVKAISEIYSYRNNIQPSKMNDVRHMIVTQNSSLALVSKRFSEINDGITILPACIPAGFLCTFLWMQEPEKLFDMNYKRIIAKCYEGLKPTKELRLKFLEVIEEQKNNDLITDDIYIFLKTSPIVENLLTVKTLGDVQRFNTKTHEEIMQELKNQGYQEAIAIIDKVKKEKTETEGKLTETEGKLAEIESELVDYIKYDNNTKKYFMNKAKTRSKRQYIVLNVLVGLSVLASIILPIIGCEFMVYVGVGFAIILGIPSIIWGCNVKELKNRIISWNKKKMEQKIETIKSYENRTEIEL